MALTRREFQLLTERVGKLEAKVRQLEDMLKILDNKIKPENITRSIKNWEDMEKAKAEKPGPLI